MGLLGHMRIHESGIDRSPETPTTSKAPTMPSPTLALSLCAPITTSTTTSSVADADTADHLCPHSPRTFSYHTGLVGHLRIHRKETGESVSGAPNYTHRTRLRCPQCPRKLPTHCMGIFGHMNTCGRKPLVAPHHHTPPCLTTIPSRIHTHRPQSPNCQFPRKYAHRLGPHATSVARAT
ncbi:hypothetical protein SprV_0501883700 [Sparganum proliferum]